MKPLAKLKQEELAALTISADPNKCFSAYRDLLYRRLRVFREEPRPPKNGELEELIYKMNQLVLESAVAAVPVQRPTDVFKFVNARIASAKATIDAAGMLNPQTIPEDHLADWLTQIEDSVKALSQSSNKPNNANNRRQKLGRIRQPRRHSEATGCKTFDFHDEFITDLPMMTDSYVRPTMHPPQNAEFDSHPEHPSLPDQDIEAILNSNYPPFQKILSDDSIWPKAVGDVGSTPAEDGQVTLESVQTGWQHRTPSPVASGIDAAFAHQNEGDELLAQLEDSVKALLDAVTKKGENLFESAK